MNNIARLKYYLGDILNNKLCIIDNYTIFTDTNINHAEIIKINKNILRNSNIKGSYKEILYFLDEIYDDKPFLFACGDIKINIDVPAFVKNRNSLLCKSIIFKSMNSKRHWNKDNFNLAINDKNKKILKCLWRGVTTGKPDIKYNNKLYFQREILVEQYFNKNEELIDVGFNKLCQGKIECKKYLKEFISIEDQLKYKFLLSIEGNDIATDLKWKLLSKSVVLMRKPTKFSWLMEDKLIPDYHYILLKDDFSDLEEKLEWAINNLEKVDEIIKNANKYMEMFLDEKNEEHLQKKIIKIYFNNVKFISSKNS